MLYHLFDELGQGALWRLFQYLTFRSGLAIILSLIISMVLGGKIIKYLHKKQYLERERELGLPGSELKKKTPSMGGLIIISSILVPCLLFADLTNIYIQLMIVSTLWMGAIGFLDDYFKLTRGKQGLSGKYKILGQVGLGLIVGLVMLYHNGIMRRN